MATQTGRGGKSGGTRGKLSGQAKLPPVKINFKPKPQSIKKQGELKRDMRMGGFSNNAGKGEVNILSIHHNTDDVNGQKVTRIFNARQGH